MIERARTAAARRMANILTEIVIHRNRDRRLSSEALPFQLVLLSECNSNSLKDLKHVTKPAEGFKMEVDSTTFKSVNI